MELLRVDGGVDGGARSPRRNELLHALREAQNAALNDTAAWAAAPDVVPGAGSRTVVRASPVKKEINQEELRYKDEAARLDSARQALSVLMGRPEAVRPVVQKEPMLPEMVGTSE